MQIAILFIYMLFIPTVAIARHFIYGSSQFRKPTHPEKKATISNRSKEINGFVLKSRFRLQ